MKPLLSLACLLLTTLLPMAQSRAEVILIIDISDPEAVTFTATGALSEADDFGETWLEDGITLLGFFSSSAFEGGIEFFDDSDLETPGGNFPYTMFTSIDMDPFGDDYTNLNIFGSGFSDQDFTTSEPALTGSALGDLSLWLSRLKTGTGDVKSGNAQYGDVILGQYVVVPEPATGLLAATALGLAAMARRRRG